MQRRFLSRVFALGLAAGTAGLGTGGCAESENVIAIIGVVAPTTSGDCTIEPSRDLAILTRSTADVTFANGVFKRLLVINQILQRGVREQVRAESSRVVLQGAEVTLAREDGREALPTFSTAATGFVDASNGEPGVGVVGVLIVPPGLLLSGGTWIATLKVFGRTLGGKDVESNNFIYPVDVCAGCLVSFNPGGGTECGGVPRSDEEISVSPCADLGVDSVVPCELCKDRLPSICNPPSNPGP